MKKKSIPPKGFTLIEMLVVIIIIAIVSTIGTNTYKNQWSQIRYNDSIVKILNLIQTAKNYSITSRPVFDENKPVGEQSYIPKEGYGVYFEQSEKPGESRIILFANTEVGDNDGVEKNQYDKGKDLVEEEYKLDSETSFRGLWIDRKNPATGIGGATENQAVIIFRPPLAEASMAVNDNPPPDSLTVLEDLYLEFKRVGVSEEIPSKYIHINKISGVAEMSK